MNQKGYALVTGASSGIGEAIAYQLAEMGFPIIVTARRKERLDKLKDRITAAFAVSVVVIEADLAVMGAGEALFAQVMAKQLEVEIVVNNAGVGCQGNFDEIDRVEVERMLLLNIHALTDLTMLFARYFKNRGAGSVLQVASLASFIDTPYVSAYAATKAYVRSFSNAIRYELRKTQVTVTVLYPGITRTEFLEVANAKTPKSMEISLLSAEDVAKAGIRGMIKGKRKVIPGKINQINAFFSAILPDRWITFFAGKMMENA